MIKVVNNGGIALHTNLSKVEEDNLKHNMRHPSEIFKIKINRLLSTLKDLDRDVQDSIKRDSQFDINESTTKKIFDYVQAIDALYDSSFLIIKSLNETVEEDNQDAIKWCKSNCKDIYSIFKSPVCRYHDLIRVISNKIKHDVLKINFVSLVNNKHVKILGFYFSNVIGEKNLNGADIDIHQRYKDSSTAFSYNFFINYTIGLIFYIADNLNRSLFKGKKLNNQEYICWPEGTDFLRILKNYSEDFFPDEYHKYCMKLEKNKNTMNIVFPYKANAYQGFKIISVQPSFIFSNNVKNKIPYHKLISS